MTSIAKPTATPERSGTSGGVIDRAMAAALKTRLRGPVLLPDEAGYDDARSVWNAMIDRRPGLIARCLGVADVVACVNFAREHSLTLSVKGGGHNIAGLAVSDGALTLDMSLMRGVWVDAPNRVAYTQAGCLLGDVDRETQMHGLAAILGFISNTGVAGLTLGGGMGYLTRRFGWTSDNVASMEVVLADGRIVQTSERENADLFWALRGGGGNFGVVTRFDFRLQPIGPEIVGGAIAWRAEEAPRVLELYQRLTREAPQVTYVAGLRAAPPAPWIAKEMHGKAIVLVVVCHTGSVADAERDVAEIKAFGSPVGDVVQRRSYASQQSLLDATQPKGRRYYWKSEYVPRLEPGLFATAVTHAQRIVSPHSAILVFPLDVANQRLAADHSAVGNRDAAAMFNIAASWEKADGDAANIEWARSTWNDLRRFSTGGTYVNFLNAEEGDERIRAAYGDNYKRLIDVKTKWDPTNMFRVNKNIAPRS